MGIDGIFLHCLKNEISTGCFGTRVDKIHQPSKEELVLLLRSPGSAKRLFISCRQSAPRICFTSFQTENPAEPPMFCMLLRKHLSGARFSCVVNNGYERTVILEFTGVNEMGDPVNFRLVTELIGKQTNVILVGGDGRIIDSVRRSDIESGGRLIQPGAVYVNPERQPKADISLSYPQTAVSAALPVNCTLEKALISVIDGVSPLIAREICVRAGEDNEKPAAELSDAEKQSVETALKSVRESAEKPVPTALYDNRGIPFEFSFMNIVQYGPSAISERFQTLSELLDTVYSERERKERIRLLGSGLNKLLSGLLGRFKRKIAAREKELAACANGERYRVFGELLKANLYAVTRGMPYIDVKNYYDPDMKTVRIPLDVALSPSQNAAKYFKEYRKCCNASAILGGLIEESRNELRYIESALDELSRAETAADLTEIKLELAEAGYLRISQNERKKKTKSKPDEAVSPDGYRVLIGRNNRQNDELTLRIASDGDMWFHTKNIPGSHVVVVCGGEELPEKTLMYAAGLAAAHSKASGSSSVPVDYTRIKYVKKPAGAKPGMVIYKTNRTVYVTPEQDNNGSRSVKK